MRLAATTAAGGGARGHSREVEGPSGEAQSLVVRAERREDDEDEENEFEASAVLENNSSHGPAKVDSGHNSRPGSITVAAAQSTSAVVSRAMAASIIHLPEIVPSASKPAPLVN
jgi:hypothetical protein